MMQTFPVQAKFRAFLLLSTTAECSGIPTAHLTPKAADVPENGTQLQWINVADLGQGVGALGDV